MRLTLRFFATFREAVGSKTVERQFADGSTVAEVLSTLEADYDGLAGALLDDGDLKPHINVLLNGREVLHLDGIETTLSEGDTLSVFPPVAGGNEERRERTFRGISKRLATHYLTGLGGEQTDDGRVEGDGWEAELTEQRVSVGPSLSLDEVRVVFHGDAETLDSLVDRFAQKAMRAGG